MRNQINKELFLQLIELERERQEKKFPNETKQKAISLDKWNTILTEELGEFAKEVNEKNDFKAIIELAEVAAVCLRISEIYFKESDLKDVRSIMHLRTTEQKPSDNE